MAELTAIDDIFAGAAAKYPSPPASPIGGILSQAADAHKVSPFPVKIPDPIPGAASIDDIFANAEAQVNRPTWQDALPELPAGALPAHIVAGVGPQNLEEEQLVENLARHAEAREEFAANPARPGVRGRAKDLGYDVMAGVSNATKMATAPLRLPSIMLDPSGEAEKILKGDRSGVSRYRDRARKTAEEQFIQGPEQQQDIGKRMFSNAIRSGLGSQVLTGGAAALTRGRGRAARAIGAGSTAALQSADAMVDRFEENIRNRVDPVIALADSMATFAAEWGPEFIGNYLQIGALNGILNPTAIGQLKRIKDLMGKRNPASWAEAERLYAGLGPFGSWFKKSLLPTVAKSLAVAGTEGLEEVATEAAGRGTSLVSGAPRSKQPYLEVFGTGAISGGLLAGASLPVEIRRNKKLTGILSDAAADPAQRREVVNLITREMQDRGLDREAGVLRVSWLDAVNKRRAIDLESSGIDQDTDPRGQIPSPLRLAQRTQEILTREDAMRDEPPAAVRPVAKVRSTSPADLLEFLQQSLPGDVDPAAVRLRPKDKLEKWQAAIRAKDAQAGLITVFYDGPPGVDLPAISGGPKVSFVPGNSQAQDAQFKARHEKGHALDAREELDPLTTETRGAIAQAVTGRKYAEHAQDLEVRRADAGLAPASAAEEFEELAQDIRAGKGAAAPGPYAVQGKSLITRRSAAERWVKQIAEQEPGKFARLKERLAAWAAVRGVPGFQLPDMRRGTVQQWGAVADAAIAELHWAETEPQKAERARLMGLLNQVPGASTALADPTSPASKQKVKHVTAPAGPFVGAGKAEKRRDFAAGRAAPGVPGEFRVGEIVRHSSTGEEYRVTEIVSEGYVRVQQDGGMPMLVPTSNLSRTIAREGGAPQRSQRPAPRTPEPAPEAPAPGGIKTWSPREELEDRARGLGISNPGILDDLELADEVARKLGERPKGLIRRTRQPDGTEAVSPVTPQTAPPSPESARTGPVQPQPAPTPAPAPRPSLIVPAGAAAAEERVAEEFAPGTMLGKSERSLISGGKLYSVIERAETGKKFPRGGVVVRDVASGKEQHLPLERARAMQRFSDEDLADIERSEYDREAKGATEVRSLIGEIKRHGGYDPGTGKGGTIRDKMKDLQPPPGVWRRGAQGRDSLATELGYENGDDLEDALRDELETGRPVFYEGDKGARFSLPALRGSQAEKDRTQNPIVTRLNQDFRPEYGDLSRGMDAYRELFSSASNEQLVDAARWVRGKSPWMARFIYSDMASVLRSRGVPVDEIKWQQENLREPAAESESTDLFTVKAQVPTGKIEPKKPQREADEGLFDKQKPDDQPRLFSLPDRKDFRAVVRLAGTELGDFGGDTARLRDAAVTWYRRHLQRGAPAYRGDLKEILFTRKGIKEFEHFGADPAKMKMVVALKEIIERGEYRGPNELKYERRDGIRKFHPIDADVALEGREFRVRVLVGEDDFQNKFFDLFPNIEEYETKKASRGFAGRELNPGSPEGPLGSIAAPDQNIGPGGENVKPEAPKSLPAFTRDDIANASPSVMSRMSGRLKKMGYDVRGAADARKLALLQADYKGGPIFDWREAWAFANGSVVSQQQKAKSKAEQFPDVDWSNISRLGLTSDLREAGYIRPDGKLVDLSGKRDGGTPGMRSYDHREAGGTEGMLQIMRAGYIRMDAAAGSVDLAVAPTPAQESVISRIAEMHHGEVVVDLADGERRWSKQYRQGTRQHRVLGDIRVFFSGKEPIESTARDFRYSLPSRHHNRKDAALSIAEHLVRYAPQGGKPVEETLAHLPAGTVYLQRVERAWRKTLHSIARWNHAMVAPARAFSKEDKKYVATRFLRDFDQEGVDREWPSPAVKEFAQAWRDVNDEIGERAEHSGIRTLTGGQSGTFKRWSPDTYVPHRLTDDARRILESQEGPEWDALLESAKANGIDVRVFLGHQDIDINQRKYGSFDYARVANLPWEIEVDGKTIQILDGNPDVLFSHIRSAARRLETVAEFGMDEASEAYINQVAQSMVSGGAETRPTIESLARIWSRLQGKDIEDARAFFGDFYESFSTVEALVAGANLSTAVIANVLGGHLPESIRMGMAPTARAFFRAYTTSVKSLEIEDLHNLIDLEGDILAGLQITETLSGRSKKIATGILRHTGFVEANRRINLGLAYGMARHNMRWMLDAIRQGKSSRFERLWGQDEGFARRYLTGELKFSEEDVDRMVLEGPDDSDLSRAIGKEAELVNAMNESPGSRPKFVAHPIFRLFFAYSTYSRKMYGTTWFAGREAKAGNFRPLATLLFAGTITGELIRAVRDAFWDREREDQGYISRFFEDMAQVATFGMLSGLQYGLSKIVDKGVRDDSYKDLINVPIVSTPLTIVAGVGQSIVEWDLRPGWKALCRVASAANLVDKQVTKRSLFPSRKRTITGERTDAPITWTAQDREYADRLVNQVYLRDRKLKNGTEVKALDPIPSLFRPKTATSLVERLRANKHTDEQIADMIREAEARRKGHGQ